MQLDYLTGYGQYFDLFAHEVKVKFDKRGSRFASIPGVVVSLIVYGAMFWLVIMLLTRLSSHTDDRVESYLFQQDLYTLGEVPLARTGFTIMLGLVDS